MSTRERRLPLSGDDCPNCDHRLQVCNTKRTGDRRIQYIGCRRCGHRAGKRIVSSCCNGAPASALSAIDDVSKASNINKTTPRNPKGHTMDGHKTLSTVADGLGVPPTAISSLFHRRHLDPTRCPLVGRVRWIPNEYIPVVKAAVAKHTRRRLQTA
jgi:hypothetical protein